MYTCKMYCRRRETNVVLCMIVEGCIGERCTNTNGVSSTFVLDLQCNGHHNGIDDRAERSE